MVSKKVLALTALFALGISLSANAGFVLVTQTPNTGTGTLANTTTNNIVVNDQGQGILSSQMRIVLTAGNIVEQGSASGNQTPPLEELIESNPNRAFDSFISAGAFTAESGDAPTIVGKSDRLGGPGGTPASFAGSGYDVLWGPAVGSIPTNRPDYLASRITLTNTSNGTFYFVQGFNNGSEWAHAAGNGLPIINGRIVPEPATCSLIGLALFGVIGTIRRRAK